MDAVTSSTVATILARNHTSGPSVILLSDGSVIVSDGSHDDLGPQINLVIWALTGTSFGFLVLRIYCKALRQRGYWWDDYVLILAWDKITLAAASAFTSASVSLGYGKHLWDFKQEELIRLPLFGQTAGFFSILAALWSKTSFAMTVLRISSGWIRRLIWFIIMSLTIVMGSSALFQWIHCMPVEKTYDYRVEGTCWAPGIMVGYFMLTTIWSGTMDVVLALLPWKIIGGLVMSRKEKIGVMVAMSMGVFAGAASLIKATKVESLRSPDPADTIDLVIWGIAEGAITIIAASIPILRALLRDPNKSTTDNVSHYMEQKPSQAGQV